MTTMDPLAIMQERFAKVVGERDALRSQLCDIGCERDAHADVRRVHEQARACLALLEFAGYGTPDTANQWVKLTKAALTDLAAVGKAHAETKSKLTALEAAARDAYERLESDGHVDSGSWGCWKCALAGRLRAALDENKAGDQHSGEQHGVSTTTAQPGALSESASPAPSPAAVDAREFVRMFTAGYRRGHHDTVEGGYTDVHASDEETYFADEVAEMLAERKVPTTVAAAVDELAPPCWCGRPARIDPGAPVRVTCSGSIFDCNRAWHWYTFDGWRALPDRRAPAIVEQELSLKALRTRLAALEAAVRDVRQAWREFDQFADDDQLRRCVANKQTHLDQSILPDKLLALRAALDGNAANEQREVAQGREHQVAPADSVRTRLPDQSPAAVDELAACPFCPMDPQAIVGQDVVAVEEDNASPWRFAVWCHGCGARSGSFKTRAEAAAAWNRRAPACVERQRSDERNVFLFGYHESQWYNVLRWIEERTPPPMEPGAQLNLVESLNRQELKWKAIRAMADAELRATPPIPAPAAPVQRPSEAIEQLARYHTVDTAGFNEIIDYISRLERRERELVEGLMPFARYASTFDETVGDEHIAAPWRSASEHSSSCILVMRLRRAAALVAAQYNTAGKERVQ